jgi:hypothetical protein
MHKAGSAGSFIRAAQWAARPSIEKEPLRLEPARREKLQRYLDRGLTAVQGWLDPHSARIIAMLGEYQTTERVSGAVGEIGVHHGKLFILLDLLKTNDEVSFAVDLFDEQELNVDQSGFGDLARLRANLEAHSDGMNRVAILKGDSTQLSADAILARCDRARLFSVDGGHTAACTLNDIRLAEASTIDDAIVIVDDYFNPSWPDVSVGVAQYALQPASTLRPFAISPNKLYLARSHCHRHYRAALGQHARRYYLKTSAMYDHEVDIYGYDQSSSRRRRLINSVKRSSVGPAIEELYRRYRTWRAP